MLTPMSRLMLIMLALMALPPMSALKQMSAFDVGVQATVSSASNVGSPGNWHAYVHPVCPLVRLA